MKCLRIYVCLVMGVFALSMFGQTDYPTYMSTDYFGPNAQPIPDMLDGTISKDLRIEIAGDYYVGFRGDHTKNIFARVYIPLYNDRINLSLWMPVIEWYTNTEESISKAYPKAKVPTSGYGFGDVYITTDIHLLKQKKICPDVALRAGIRTASGSGIYTARYFDSPGYFFDASFAKSIFFKRNFFQELRFVGSGGFYCWQTNNFRQNDATMYGAQIKLRTRYFSFSETWSGYSGWEYYGDCPESLKTNVTFHIRAWEPFLAYQYGLHDYPYHQFRVGVAYQINILKRK